MRSDLFFHNTDKFGIDDESEFIEKIKLEKCRRQRLGTVFSLMIINLEGQSYWEIEYLINHLKERVRLIDSIGWVKGNRVGIILPGCNGEAAKKLVRSMVDNDTSPPPVEMYFYRDTSEEHPALSFSSLDDKPGEGDITVRIPRWKRGMDILGSGLGIFMLSPLFAAVALLIKAVSPGPVFYKQLRVGKSGSNFTLWKFRTMHVNQSSKGHQAYLSDLIHGSDDGGENGPAMVKLDESNDPRIIRFGHFLRKSCIDELPQLFNVFLGEMSLVGPRPPIPYEVEEYSLWHGGRLDAVPGMTGLWQVNGKNNLSFKEMVRLDIQYSRSCSLWTDVKILLKTPLVVFKQMFGGFLRRSIVQIDGV